MERTWTQDTGQELTEAIRLLELGKQVAVRFLGDPHPVGFKVAFAGGWAIEFTVAPGMEAILTRGTDETSPTSIDISIMPYEGLK